MYILAYENDLTGFLMYRTERKVMYVYEVHVDELYRGKGIGSMLLKCAYGVLEKKYEKMVLFVDRRNLGAVKFYVSNGMARDIEEEYEGSGYEAYSYVRRGVDAEN